MVDRRYPPGLLSLSVYGVRLVAAGTGHDGGIDQIPRVADLARRLGFRVLAVIDRDKDGAQAASQLAKILAACDIVIRLPKGAIERAMLAGIDLDKIVAASATLTAYNIPDPVAGRADESVVTDLCKVIHKQGLHEQLLDAPLRRDRRSSADDRYRARLDHRRGQPQIQRPCIDQSACSPCRNAMIGLLALTA